MNTTAGAKKKKRKIGKTLKYRDNVFSLSFFFFLSERINIRIYIYIFIYIKLSAIELFSSAVARTTVEITKAT